MHDPELLPDPAPPEILDRLEERRDSTPPVRGARSGRLRVVVAGASGFVGRALLPRLAERFDVIGLSRSERSAAPDAPIQWRQADLFSLYDADRALEGADLALYLVHSMLPTAALTQASFEDLDLIAADNFARAAKRAGVRQIVYLGGLIPDRGQAKLSPHLRSRYEVERTLRAHGTPVTALRAGLVVGTGGSSFRMLLRLVERLPYMATPKWTATRTQPVALADVIEAFDYVLDREDCFDEDFDLGCPRVWTFREMIEATAVALQLKRRLVSVPLLSPRLSTLWVSMITGAPRALVGPLVESMRHPTVCRDRRLQERMGNAGVSFPEALAAAIPGERALAEPKPARTSQSPGRAVVPASPERQRDVRSVQRLPLPPGWSARDVARAYAEWLPRFMGPMISVSRVGDDTLDFNVGATNQTLLRLRYSEARSSSDRALYYVIGGHLASVDPSWERRARLEFREVLGDSVLAAIHDFVPRLPWYVYTVSQAPLHLFVMKGFRSYLRRSALQGAPPPHPAHPLLPAPEVGGA